jgi:hypothetical protein
MSTQLAKTKAKLSKVKQELLSLGDIRPGSITKQYRLPKQKKRPFYQVSYTHHMRSRSEYVRPENVAILRKETANFKRFKKLVNLWIDLSLTASRLRLSAATNRHSGG